MTDLSQMIRWNTGFIRGLAQSVLERAKVIRSGLTSYSATPEVNASATPKTSKAKRTGTSKKKTAAKPKTRARNPRRRRG